MRQQTIKPFLASDSLRVVRILDLDPGKRITAGFGLAANSFQVLRPRDYIYSIGPASRGDRGTGACSGVARRHSACVGISGPRIRTSREDTRDGELIKQMKFRASERPVAASIAAAYVGLGNNDLALDWLEKAADNRSSWLVWSATEPWWDPLRKHPRFQALLDRLNLHLRQNTTVTRH